jgi:ribosome modulation factor
MKDINELLPDIKLRFSIEHPNFEDCYRDGYRAALIDLSDEDNPFQLSSKESDQWLEGWWAGFYGETPLYEPILDTDHPVTAANDQVYHDSMADFFEKLLEITGILAVSAVVGYQLIDLVA